VTVQVSLNITLVTKPDVFSAATLAQWSLSMLFKVLLDLTVSPFLASFSVSFPARLSLFRGFGGVFLSAVLVDFFFILFVPSALMLTNPLTVFVVPLPLASPNALTALIVSLSRVGANCKILNGK
jgi:hypothetical protein